jgi:uncharacterized protein (TIGR01777 family)
MLGSMRIVLAGGTGFLGRALHARLRAERHQVIVLTRHAARDPEHIPWQPNGASGGWARALSHADAVVNLAGEGIADARWTAARKRALRDSRLLSTRSIVAAIRDLSPRPAVLVNASGVGYYGDRGAQIVAEDTAVGSDFLAALCASWEHEARQAASLTRVAILRSGLVLHPSGGALARMLLPFRLGIGGRLGSGRQFLPWIHRDDWLDLVMWIIATPAAAGPFNATSPEPVTNADFTRALGRALRRPTLVPAPAPGLRLAFGELADTLLTGQRAIPQRALELGFRFTFSEIDRALGDLVGRRTE